MSLGRITLSSLLILSLCACGNVHSSISENDYDSTESSLSTEKNEDLENMINDAMTALKNLDMDQFNAYTNNKQIMVTPWGSEKVEYTLFGELSEKQQTDSGEDFAYQLDQEIVKNLTWKILDIAQDHNTAKLTLRITNLNMEGVFQRAETDTEIINEIKKIPLNDTKTVDIKLIAKKQDEAWILYIDVDFANAVSSKIWVFDTTDCLTESSPHRSVREDNFLPEFSGNSIVENSKRNPYTYNGIADASKEQKIEIVSADDDRIIAQITDLQEITDFLNQEEGYNWTIVESIPDNSKPILSVIRYALERKTKNPQLKEQSQNLLYQAEDIYYIEDRTKYSCTDTMDYEFPRYYVIPNTAGNYLQQFLQ